MSETNRENTNEAEDLGALYEGRIPFYKEMGDQFEDLLKRTVPVHLVHKISNRAKTAESFRKKIRKDAAKYRDLSHVTDKVGLRIVTLFAEDVDIVASRIEEQFEIDRDNSTDKRKILKSDQFGYLSLHYIARISESRRSLPEYSDFSDEFVEIQIRSILQHAWAEIEHKLGYKAQDALPDTIRRRFSRLAGLLEIADTEFTSLRELVSEFSDKGVDVTDSATKTVLVDQFSIQQLIAESAVVRDLDRSIVQSLGSARLIGSTPAVVLRTTAEKLKFLAVDEVAHLENQLTRYAARIPKFGKAWLGEDDRVRSFANGISIVILGLVLLAEVGLEERSLEFHRRFHEPEDGASTGAEFHQRLVHTLKISI